jgi:hypothetical protein
LTAKNLKNALWKTLNELRDDKIGAASADAIAAQAREILRTGRLQLQITSQAKRNVPAELITFSES